MLVFMMAGFLSIFTSISGAKPHPLYTVDKSNSGLEHSMAYWSVHPLNTLKWIGKLMY